MPSRDPQQNPFAQLLAVAREVSSNVDAWFVGRDDFRALVAGRELAALDIQRTITRTLADKLRVLNDRVREHPAFEDRPITQPAPATDPLEQRDG